MRNRATTDVLLLAQALGPGESKRITCPACGGGANVDTSTLSLSLSEDGTVLWQCFRASCNFRGRHGGNGVVRTTQPGVRKQAFTPFKGDLRHCTDEELEVLSQLGFTAIHNDIARVMYAPIEQRFAFPIFGPMGHRRGWMLRSYVGAEPKALTRMDCAEPHMSWYRLGDTTPTILVEDIPSAVRAARYTGAVSLCGTGCGPEYANELASHTRNVIWALDADATATAIRWHRRYSMMFDSSRVLPLPKDLKNMTEPELITLLGENL